MDPNQPPHVPPAPEQAPPASYFPPQQPAPVAAPPAMAPPPPPAAFPPPPMPASAPFAGPPSTFAAPAAPNAEAGPSSVPVTLAAPVRPLKGPGSRGGRGGSGRGRGRGGSRVDSDYAINRPVRIRKAVQRPGIGDEDYDYDDGDDFDDGYIGSSSKNHYASSHTRHTNTHRPNFEGKIKLNLKGGAQRGGKGRGGRYSSFLGEYDRELDTDEEEIVFEEQFILRMPEGEPAEKLRSMVKEKNPKKGLEDVWFKFKDSRRAVFKLADQLYSAKLVDLPSIIEAQKTLDGKQMFKAADISQMLVVSNPISDESQAMDGNGGGGKLNIEDYIWPHGVTPPLRHVRKRRYRKRISRRTIEVVEEEVERMLAQDSRAEKVTYDIIEDADPDASDSEFLTPRGTPKKLPQQHGSQFGSQFGDDSEMGDGEIFEGGATPRNGNDDADDNLAAELARGLKELEDSDEDEGEGDDEDDEDDDDDDEASERPSDDEEGSVADSEDEEAVEIAQRQKLLNEEIRDLETAVARKKTEIAASSNAIIKKRFEDALRKLQADLDLKLSARSTITREKEKRKREDEEEKEREHGLQESAMQEDQRLANVASHLVVPPPPTLGGGGGGGGSARPGGLVIPPLPSMASSSGGGGGAAVRPHLPIPPPPKIHTQIPFAPSQPSSLSTVHLPPPVPAPVGDDLDSQMEAAAHGTDSEEDGVGEESVHGGTQGGDEEDDEAEEEEDLFGDDDDGEDAAQAEGGGGTEEEDEEDDDMQEMIVD